MSFPHLHVATAFSAHFGVSRPAVLAAAAAADGADALACTDRDGLYGAIKHLGACREHGIDPVLGADLALLDPGRERALGRVHQRLEIGTAHRHGVRRFGHELDHAHRYACLRCPTQITTTSGVPFGTTSDGRTATASDGFVTSTPCAAAAGSPTLSPSGAGASTTL